MECLGNQGISQRLGSAGVLYLRIDMDSLLKEKNAQTLYFGVPVILFFTFEFSGKGSSFPAFSALK